MPLPFLTADGALDERGTAAGTGQDGPAPRLDERWRRPYSPGPWRVAGAALLLVLASYLLFATVIVEAAGTGSGAVAMLTAGVLVVASTVRLLRVGVWVSRQGLRVVTPLRTTTLRWEQVGAVRTAQQPVRLLMLPRTVQGQALLMRRADGTALPSLLTDHSPDFLGRPESFDVTADLIESLAEELGRG